MNFRKDVQSLTEAYKHITEAPTDPGPSFNEPADTPDVKYIGGDVTGGGGDISPEDKQDCRSCSRSLPAHRQSKFKLCSSCYSK